MEPVIECDAADGIITLIVNSDILANFPQFMNYVIKKKIGLEHGFFKVGVVCDKVLSS